MDPFVLRDFLIEKDWLPMKLWTDEYLCQHFLYGKKPIVRLGKKFHTKGEILHDHKSAHHEFENIKQMLSWMNGEQIKFSNLQSDASTDTHWAYLDYKDILEILEKKEAESVDWVKLGVVQRVEGEEAWRDSTIWIGTAGAYTPCHYDTYGFNLHAQIRGHKRWLLFPPGTNLRPTRLPYEESSVFSSLDLLSGPTKEDANIWQGITPRVVTLGPGDLLFVPPRWWHSVQCVNNDLSSTTSRVCLSVNKWFSVNQDRRESAKEALLKFMMTMFTESGLLDAQEFVCLTERQSMEEVDLEELTEFVQFRLNLSEEQSENETGKDDVSNESTAKRPKLALQHQPKSQLDFFYSNFSRHPQAEQIPAVQWENLKKSNEENDEEELNGENEVGKRTDEMEEELDKKQSSATQLKMQLLDSLSSSEVLETLLGVMMKRRGINALIEKQ